MPWGGRIDRKRLQVRYDDTTVLPVSNSSFSNGGPYVCGGYILRMRHSLKSILNMSTVPLAVSRSRVHHVDKQPGGDPVSGL